MDARHFGLLAGACEDNTATPCIHGVSSHCGLLSLLSTCFASPLMNLTASGPNAEPAEGGAEYRDKAAKKRA
jgi:hypothetical protein